MSASEAAADRIFRSFRAHVRLKGRLCSVPIDSGGGTRYLPRALPGFSPRKSESMSVPKKTVVLLASDLMLSSTVSGWASAVDLEFRSAASVEETLTLVAESGPCLLLVDLGAPDLEIRKLAQNLPTDVLQHAVAYGPHVHAQKLTTAREVGFGNVMSRGQFSARIGSLLKSVADFNG